LEEPIAAEKKKEYYPRIINFIYTITKKTLYEKDYKQIGRLPRFFNPKERKEFPNLNLFMWPGYDINIKALNDGIFLNLDTATKFVNMDNAYQRIRDLKREKYSNEEITGMLCPKDPNQKRLVVITLYNSRSY